MSFGSGNGASGAVSCALTMGAARVNAKADKPARSAVVRDGLVDRVI
jgi:hypothetical protein